MSLDVKAVGEIGHQNKYILLHQNYQFHLCLQAKLRSRIYKRTMEQAHTKINFNGNEVLGTKTLTLLVITKYVYLFAQEKGIEWNA